MTMTIEQALYHVEHYAERLRRGHAPAIGQGMIDAVMTCWRAAELRDDVALIMRTYPREFPMTAKMGAD